MESDKTKTENESGRRERRRATHLVNYYAREDELDAELNEASSGDEAPQQEKRRRTPPAGGRPHASKICPGCGRTVGNASQVCKHCDYTFATGSRKSSAAHSSSGHHGRLNSGNERKHPVSFLEEREPDSGERIIDKIIGRIGEDKFGSLYLVKFKGVAAVHAEWLTAERICQMGKRSKQIFQRYVTRDEEAPPPQSSFAIDRVVDVRVAEKDPGGSEEAGDDDNPSKDFVPKPPIPFIHIENSRQHKRVKLLSDAKQKKKRLETWQPMERCLHLVKKLSLLPEAEPFVVPVDATYLPDYEVLVPKPMDLGTIETRLTQGNFYKDDPEAVLKDIRLTWSNCKNYNEQGSSIWRAAVVLGMATDRLYEAWVNSPKDDGEEGLAAEGPAFRPWESGCRGCQVRDDEVVLCDHCDAEYHVGCRFDESVRRAVVRFAGEKVWRVVSSQAESSPDESWVCAVCCARSIRSRMRGASASVEDAYRETIQRALDKEKSDEVVKTKVGLEYLVKWADLSYKECTWETTRTLVKVGAARAVKRFHAQRPGTMARARLEVERRRCTGSNKSVLDERSRVVFAEGPAKLPAAAPPSSESSIISPMGDARSVLYAQLECFRTMCEDGKGADLDDSLLRRCGPATYARALKRGEEGVGEALSSAIYCAARGTVSTASPLGPARPGEYDAVLPKNGGAVGLHLKHAKSDAVTPSLWVAKVPCGVNSPCAGVVGACDAVVSCQGHLVDDGRQMTPVAKRFATTVNAVRSAPLYVRCRFRRSDMHSNSDAAQGSIEQLRRHIQENAGALTLHKLLEFMPSSSIMSSLASISETRVYPTEDLFGWNSITIDASTTPGGWRARGILYPSALEAAAALDAAEQAEHGNKAPRPRCSPGGRPGRARATPSTYRAGFLSHWAINRAIVDAFHHPNLPSSFTSRTATNRLARLLGVDVETTETKDDDDNSVSDERIAADATPETPRPDPSRKLRDYQERGVSWMLDCRANRRGSILADEMGLGKTAQICAYLQRLTTRFNDRPCLIVAPLSTIGHWARELESWTSLTVCNYHDNGRDARDLRRHFEWWPRDDQETQQSSSYRNHDPKNTAFDVLVTTYDELIRDADELCSVAWASCAVDEAHRLKNEKGRLIESLQFVLNLGVKQRNYQHRVLLTGTPLQNDTKELWTLMNFIQHDKGTFAKGEARQSFDARFGQMETAEQVRELQGEIAPHLLRRVKEDVATDIPIKRETVIDVELTLAQKRYYRALYEKNVSALAALRRASNGGAPPSHNDEEASSSAAAAGSSMPTMNNLQMELRKCCNHPFLLRGVRDAELEKLQDELLQEQGREVFDARSFQAHVGDRLLVPQAGKMVLLDKLLPKLRKEGHKVLIFSQMVKMLTLLAEFCQHRDYPYETLDGRVRGDERQRAIDRFNDPSHDSFVFLLSTRAGGVGVNLVAADTVIIYDSDWNPQNDVQAMARCHRLGQTKDVMVYRLVATRTFEGEMFERASRKLGLERAVLSGDAFDTNNGASSAAKKGAQAPTATELEQLLRRGAYGLVEANDEAESRARAFCEADIEQILEERATVRVVEGEQTAGWLNKSSFSVENQELSVNDPAFWEKAMPDMRTPELLLSRLDRGFVLAVPAKERQQPASDAVKEPGNSEEEEGAALIKEEGDDAAEEDDGVEIDQELKAAFVSDLEMLVAGALKRRYRGSLSDAERQSTMQLLLRASLDQSFTEKERAEASLWYKQLEGNRRRVKVVHLQQQQQQKDEEDDDDNDDDDDDDDAGDEDNDGDDVSDDEDDDDEDAEDEDGPAKSSKRRRHRDRRLNGSALPTRNKHPKRKAAKKGSYALGEEEDAMIDDDADPRNLLARLDEATGEAFVSGKKLKKERSEVLPEPPKPPPAEAIVGMMSQIVKYEGTLFYVARNDDTAGGVADMLGESIDSASLVRLNKSRFSGLSKHARLMASTCLALPDSYSQAEADEFNENVDKRPPVAPRRPNERYQSYAATSSNGRGSYASGGASYEVAISTPAVAVFAPTPGLCGSCGGSGDIGLLLECKSCGIVVHCGCYGVDEDQFETPSQGEDSSKRRSRTKKKKNVEDWICDVCTHVAAAEDGAMIPRKKKSSKKRASASTPPTKYPPCILCSYRGGPMKAVEKGGWAHVHCATFIPEVAFRDTTIMSPVCDISRIRAERYSAPCVLCGKSGHASPLGGGPTVRCSRTGNATRCNAWFHPSCAFAAGCGLLITSDDSQVYSDKISIIQYCPRHTTHFFPTPPPKFAILDEAPPEEGEEADGDTKKPRRASNGKVPLRGGGKGDDNKRQRRAAAKKAAEHFAGESEEEDDDDDDDDDEEEDDTGVHCICKQPADPSDLYIQCDSCGAWLHPCCVGVEDEAAEKLDSFTCPTCQENGDGKRPSLPRRSQKTKKRYRDDDDDNDDEESQQQEEELCVCGRADADGDFFIGCDGCGKWYHPECVGVDPEDAEAMDSYTCDRCSKQKGRSSSRSSSATRNGAAIKRRRR